MKNTNWEKIELKEQVKLQNEISSFIHSRKSFSINDKDGLGEMTIMIVTIFCSVIKDYIVKVIDMSALELRLDVDSYDIGLTELLIARKNFLDKEEVRNEKIFNSVIGK